MKKIQMILLSLLLFGGLFIPHASAHRFEDVPEWAKDEINYLSNEKIVYGVSAHRFGSTAIIKRGDAALMLARAKKIPHEQTGQPTRFVDVDQTRYYAGAIEAVADAGYLSGYPGGRFGPDDPLTREQMAKIIADAYKLTGGRPGFFKDIGKSWARPEIEAVAANGIAIGTDVGIFSPKKQITRAEFAVMLARASADDFKIKAPAPHPSKLSTADIVKLNDEKVVLIQTNRSQGSGVIVGAGLILTNEHVIRGMTRGTITLSDGTRHTIAGIVAASETRDLALLKTTTELAHVTPAVIGSVTTLEKGSQVVAIGSPHGLQNTVSEGIVSAFRLQNGTRQIQISAALDTGSSGGGLFDGTGELVGITTSGIASPANLNFAVSIAEAAQWSHYMTMPFAAIPFTEFTQTDQLTIPGLEHIALGMTKAAVKQAETASLSYEDETALTFDDKTVFAFPAQVTYEFVDNHLTQIGIFHHFVDNQDDVYLLESYFDVMCGEITLLYGEPIYYDTDWSPVTNGYALVAYWHDTEKDLYLSAKRDVEASSYGGILIALN